MFFGLILIAVGIFALLVNLDVLSGSLWSYVWPTVLIILGLGFFWKRHHWRTHRWHHWCCHDEEKEEKR
jgi:hypothetical protein